MCVEGGGHACLREIRGMWSRGGQNHIEDPQGEREKDRERNQSLNMGSERTRRHLLVCVCVCVSWSEGGARSLC